MNKKTTYQNILNVANQPVTVIGRDLGAVSAQKVESLVDFGSQEGVQILRDAKENGRYVNFLADESKIKTLIIMDSGKVYPSTFNLSTLAKRIYDASCIDQLDINNN